jgi:lipoate-protein ligase B
MSQKVNTFFGDDPFEEEVVQIPAGRGEKIMYHGPGALELYELYKEHEEKTISSKAMVKQMNGDCIVEGTVFSKTEDSAFVDIHSKETIFVNLKKEDPIS